MGGIHRLEILGSIWYKQSYLPLRSYIKVSFFESPPGLWHKLQIAHLQLGGGEMCVTFLRERGPPPVGKFSLLP